MPDFLSFDPSEVDESPESAAVTQPKQPALKTFDVSDVDGIVYGKNNPGNIKNPDGSFKDFDTPELGWDALRGDIRAKITGKTRTGLTGKNSIAELGDKYLGLKRIGNNEYAPATEKNDIVQLPDGRKVSAWAYNVSNKLGVDVDAKIGDFADKLDDFAQAVAHAEGRKDVPFPGASATSIGNTRSAFTVSPEEFLNDLEPLPLDEWKSSLDEGEARLKENQEALEGTAQSLDYRRNQLDHKLADAFLYGRGGNDKLAELPLQQVGPFPTPGQPGYVTTAPIFGQRGEQLFDPGRLAEHNALAGPFDRDVQAFNQQGEQADQEQDVYNAGVQAYNAELNRQKQAEQHRAEVSRLADQALHESAAGGGGSIDAAIANVKEPKFYVNHPIGANREDIIKELEARKTAAAQQNQILGEEPKANTPTIISSNIQRVKTPLLDDSPYATVRRTVLGPVQEAVNELSDKVLIGPGQLVHAPALRAVSGQTPYEIRPEDAKQRVLIALPGGPTVPVPLDLAKATGNAVMGLLSPESLALQLVTGFGSTAAELAANSAPVLKLLKNAPPALREAVEIIARGSVPGGVAVAAQDQAIRAGAEAVNAKDEQTRRVKAVEAFTSMLILGAAGAHAIKSGVEAAQLHPPSATPQQRATAQQTGGIAASTPEAVRQSAAIADSLEKRGNRLAAQNWRELDFESPRPVTLPDGRPGFVTKETKPAGAKHAYQAVYDTDGNIVYGGTPAMVGEWFRHLAPEPGEPVPQMGYGGPGSPEMRPESLTPGMRRVDISTPVADVRATGGDPVQLEILKTSEAIERLGEQRSEIMSARDKARNAGQPTAELDAALKDANTRLGNLKRQLNDLQNPVYTGETPAAETKAPESETEYTRRVTIGDARDLTRQQAETRLEEITRQRKATDPASPEYMKLQEEGDRLELRLQELDPERKRKARIATLTHDIQWKSQMLVDPESFSNPETREAAGIINADFNQQIQEHRDELAALQTSAKGQDESQKDRKPESPIVKGAQSADGKLKVLSVSAKNVIYQLQGDEGTKTASLPLKKFEEQYGSHLQQTPSSTKSSSEEQASAGPATPPPAAPVATPQAGVSQTEENATVPPASPKPAAETNAPQAAGPQVSPPASQDTTAPSSPKEPAKEESQPAGEPGPRRPPMGMYEQLLADTSIPSAHQSVLDQISEHDAVYFKEFVLGPHGENPIQETGGLFLKWRPDGKAEISVDGQPRSVDARLITRAKKWDASQRKNVEIKPSTVEQPANTTPSAGESAPGKQTVQTKEEPKESVHKNSSTQLNLSPELSKAVASFGKSIPDAQLNPNEPQARQPEDDIHITVKYRAGEDVDAIRKVVEGHGPITVTFQTASVFENEDGDVLKVGVKSPELDALNAKLTKAFPHKDDYPTFQPHVTIAYLKSGEGKQYAGKPVPGVSGKKVTLDTLTFSGKDGKTVDIKLAGTADNISPAQQSGADNISAETPTKPAEKPVAERGPGWVGNIPTSEIHVDAPRFQFKQNVGQGGAGEELRSVTKWDPEKAGITLVWKDPANGKTYVVNGHHRIELAQRLNVPEMTVRYIDAKTAQQARTKGALVNIAEGRGESLDAAKVFRDSGMTSAELETEGVSLKGKIASEGLALANLAQPIFEDVVSGELSPARGAVIGAGVPNHADQKALYGLMKEREKNGKRLTNDQIGELIRLTNQTSTITESTADDAQGGLFGSEEMTRSLMPEKAEISDYVRKNLAAERKLFAAVSTQAASEKLEATGNVIKAGENAQVAERANQGIVLYDKLSTKAGAIDTALDRAARSLADGENPSEVKKRAYTQIRAELIRYANQLAGVPESSAPGSEGHGGKGSDQTGAGQSDTTAPAREEVKSEPAKEEPKKEETPAAAEAKSEHDPAALGNFIDSLPAAKQPYARAYAESFMGKSNPKAIRDALQQLTEDQRKRLVVLALAQKAWLEKQPVKEETKPTKDETSKRPWEMPYRQWLAHEASAFGDKAKTPTRQGYDWHRGHINTAERAGNTIPAEVETEQRQIRLGDSYVKGIVDASQRFYAGAYRDHLMGIRPEVPAEHEGSWSNITPDQARGIRNHLNSIFEQPIEAEPKTEYPDVREGDVVVFDDAQGTHQGNVVAVYHGGSQMEVRIPARGGKEARSVSIRYGQIRKINGDAIERPAEGEPSKDSGVAGAAGLTPQQIIAQLKQKLADKQEKKEPEKQVDPLASTILFNDSQRIDGIVATAKRAIENTPSSARMEIVRLQQELVGAREHLEKLADAGDSQRKLLTQSIADADTLIASYEKDNPRPSVEQKAKEVWGKMNFNERKAVSAGLFPDGKMKLAVAEGYDTRELAVALMDIAARQIGKPNQPANKPTKRPEVGDRVQVNRHTGMGARDEDFGVIDNISTDGKSVLVKFDNGTEASVPRADVSASTRPMPKPTKAAPPANEPKPENPFKAAADQERQKLKDLMDRAKGRKPASLQSRQQGPSVDPELLMSLATIGMEHMADGITDYHDWSVRMKDDMGEVIDWIAEKSNLSPEEVLRQVHGFGRAAVKDFGYDVPEAPAVSAQPQQPQQSEQPTGDPKLEGALRLMDAVYQKLKNGESLGNVTEFNKLAEDAFGASRASGEWTPKDAFDAMEAGINKILIERGADLLLAKDPIEAIQELRSLMDRITSQASVRTEDQLANQQFSTPPTLSFLAALAANLNPGDVSLEPSAGNGGLAVWPKSLGAKVHVNEISERRRQMLEAVGFDKPTDFDGELINAYLDKSVKPTVVIMNPPFSASTTKSHAAANNNKYGFNHVDQALQTLQPGGRAVIILGGGRADDTNGGASLTTGPSGKWFERVARQYNVRANVRIHGREYQKYGTSFATRLIVIDNNGPTPSQTTPGQPKSWNSVVQGNVDTIEQAYNLLQDVRATRPQIQVTGGTGTGSGTGAGSGQSGTRPGANPSGAGPRAGGVPGSGGADSGAGESSGQTGGSAGGHGGVAGDSAAQPSGGEQSGSGSVGHTAPAGADDTQGGARDVNDQRPPLDLERADEAAENTEAENSPFISYNPSIKGPKHPGDIVETRTMATVPMPPITYRPSLPPSVLENGALSAVQLEAIAMAGQQNHIELPGGAYASALIGDGTGVGKGRISAGILWDNYRQGRKRLVWVSEKWDLMQDAVRDLRGIGATDITRGIEASASGKNIFKPNAGVKGFNQFGAGKKIEHDGVLFTTYALIRSKSSKGDRRVDQLKEYLLGDDNGEGAYILFDESHNLKNAVAGRGMQESQIGRAVKELLDQVPKVRTVSLSATAATDVINLGYLDRLGLWGPGTAFPNGFGEFQTQIAPGGLAAMEMIARELKAQGKYVSRTLSFKGVTYDTHTHKLNDDQKAMYRTAADAWKSIINSVEATIANVTNGGNDQRRNFMTQFGGAQQRFFGLLITALKTPSVIELANKALADNKSVVITLVNTNEAAQNREKAKLKDQDPEDEPPEFDFGPKEMLKQLVLQHYPVQQYVDDVDSSGNPIKVPLYDVDENGREVPRLNPAAVAARDALIAQLDRDLHMPENPLDILINGLGGDKHVAELTGRKEKYDYSTGKFVQRGDAKATKDEINLFEMRAFQGGQKRVAVLSSAAGTGISLHAANDAKNQQKRLHITLQPGWSADKAMQMLGRTHRTNQAHPPEYVFLVTDLAGEKRFVSTITRRIGSLGALTKGQKNAAGAGSAMGDDANIETNEGRAAANGFYTALEGNIAVPGTNLTGLQVLSDMRVLTPDGHVRPADKTNVTKMMNRLLALDPDVQNPVYNYFYAIFDAAVQRAIEQGTLDTGVKSLPGDHFQVKESRVLSKDPKTGAETFYYPVEVKTRIKRLSPEELDDKIEQNEQRQPAILRNPETGKMMLVYDAPPRVQASGQVDPAFYTHRPENGKRIKMDRGELPRGMRDVTEWANEQLEKAQNSYDSAKRQLDRDEKTLREATERQRDIAVRDAEADVRYAEAKLQDANASVMSGGMLPSERLRYQQYLERAKADLEKARNFELPANDWRRGSIPYSQKAVAEAEKPLADAKAIAANPTAWAKERWKENYEAAPTHHTSDHHLIGGAVMRFWNPIKDSAHIKNSIFTTSDTETGQRVVGVEIPANRIQGLLQRIGGGQSTVNLQQLHDDVLRNNTTYMLEGNIPVRRGRVGRNLVIQLMPPTPEIGRTLQQLGVIYERGINPIYYIPSQYEGPMAQRTQGILARVLGQFPVKADDQPTSLQSRRQNGPSLFDDNAPVPESAPETGQTQIIERFPGEEGTEAVVAKISGNRYSVALRDIDADQYLDSVKIFPTLQTAITHAKTITRQTSLVSPQEESDSRTAEQKAKDKLLGEQLTAQARSGLAARPTKLKPAQTRGLFEEEGPEQDTLFARRPENISTRPLAVPQEIARYFRRTTDDFRGRPEEALEWVRHTPDGFARGAILHPEFPNGIGLLHGEPGDPEKDWRGGFGVSHADAKRTGYLDEAIRIIPTLPVIETITNPKTGRVLGKVLSDGKHRAVVSHDLRGHATPAWVLTAYERPAHATSSGVSEASKGPGPTPPETDLATSVPEQDTAKGEDEAGNLSSRRSNHPDQIDLFEHRSTSLDKAQRSEPRSTTVRVDASKIKRLAEPARPKNPALPTPQELETYWGGAQSRLYPIGGQTALLVNHPAMQALLYRMGQVASGESANQTVGITLAPSEWMNILEEARAAQRNPETPFDRALIRLAQDIVKAVGRPDLLQPRAETPQLNGYGEPMDRDLKQLPEFVHPTQQPGKSADALKGRPLIVVQAGANVPDRVLQVTAEEEFDHAQQMALPRGLRSLPTRIVYTEAGMIAAKALGRQGYPSLDPKSPFFARNLGVVTAEIGVRLMRPGRYVELGLTAQQARDLATEFITGLVRENGDKASAIADQMYETLETLNPRFGGSQTEHAPVRGGAQTIGERGPPSRVGPLVSGDQTEPGFLASRRRRPNAPEVNYTGLGAKKDIYVRNLSQIEKANPEVHMAAVKLATSRAQAMALLRSNTPAIVKALAPSHISFTDFRRTLIESRLRGLRQRWQEQADFATSATDQQMKEAAADWLIELMKHIESRAGLPDDMAQTAAAIAQDEDWDLLRDFSAQQFQEAANRVARMMPEDEFDRNTSDPGFRKALDIYKRNVESEMAKSHDSNEGVFSTALGPLDTYYPLVPLTEEEQHAKAANSKRPYVKPRNINNNFATGLAEAYDPGMAVFGDKLRDSFRTNNKAALINTLVDQGIAKKVQQGQTAPDSINVNGRELAATVVEFSEPRTIVTPKGTIHVPPTRVLIPSFLEHELQPILDKKNLTLYDPESLIGRITQITLFGPLDAVIHSSNLVGTIVANTPFLGKNFTDKTVKNTPLTKKLATIVDLVRTDPTTEEAARDIAEMAAYGAIPEKYGTMASTWFQKGREYTEEMGEDVDGKKTFGPFLYGPKGIDIRARLLMHRIAKAVNPNATPQEMYLFVNQLGNYTRALQGSLERILKESQFSTFYTAGSSMSRNGINAVLGTGPIITPKPGGGKWAQRAAMALTGGVIGTIALWIVLHEALRGEMPWDDKFGKLLRVRATPQQRRSWIGKQLWGTGPEEGYLNMTWFSPIVARGLRAVGAQGAYDKWIAKGSADQILDAAGTGPFNAALHPMLGPPAKAAFVGLFGSEPYLTSFRNDRGVPTGSWLNVVNPQKPGAMGFVKQHFVSPVITMNGLFEDLGNATGLTNGIMRESHTDANRWMRMAIDLALPNLVDKPSKPGAVIGYLQRQRRAEESAARKRSR